MPLNIIYGTAGTGKTHACLRSIAELCAHEPLGAPLYLIVPEQATFEAEKQLAAMCGGGFMRASALGFKRFAYQVLRECGRGGKAISDSARRMVIKRLLQENSHQLNAYNRVSGERSMPTALAQLFRELKNSAIMPRDLATCSGESNNDKFADLQLLYSAWENYKSQHGYLDPEDYLNELPACLPYSTMLSGAQFWLDGFSYFSRTELTLLNALIAAGHAVTISLCIDSEIADYADENELFYQPWNTLQRLRKLKGEITYHNLSIPWRFTEHSAIYHAGQVLRGININKPHTSGIVLAKATSPLEEARFIAREIVHLLRKKKYYLRDIAIAGRNIDEYRGVIESALDEANLRYAFDVPPTLSRHMLTDFVRAIMEIKLRNRDYHSMFTAIKTGMLENKTYKTADFDELENYVLRYGIRGNTWTQKSSWDFASKEAEFSGRQPVFDDAVLNQLRLYINSSIAPFVEHRDSSLTVRDYIERIENVFIKLEIEQRITHAAECARERNDTATAALHVRVWNCVAELLDELIKVCGEQAIKLEDFSGLLTEGFDAVQLKITPPGLDYISICSLDRMKMPERRAIFLFALNEGVIPRRGAGNALLTDSDSAQLEAAGLNPINSIRGALFADRFVLYTALSQAKERLYMSYSIASASGKTREPSIYYEKIRNVLALKPHLAASYALLRERAAYDKHIASNHAVSWCVAESIFASIYSSHLDTEVDLSYWRIIQDELFAKGDNIVLKAQMRKRLTTISPQLTQALYVKDGAFPCSISKLETFAHCPFKFFAQYGLKLRERAVRELDALDVGNIYHAVLQNLGNNILSMSDECIIEFCKREFDELKIRIKNQLFIKAAYDTNLANRLYRRFEKAVLRFAAFSRAIKLKPIFFEQNFGRGAKWQALEVQTDSIAALIEGKIDRIDCGFINNISQALLVDYKSNRYDVDYAKLYHGLSLQLPIYMAALQKNMRNIEIAGMLYLGMKDDRVTAKITDTIQNIEKNRFEKTSFTGILNSNNEVADINEEGYDSANYIDIEKNFCDSHGFAVLKNNAVLRVAQFTSGIMAGNVAVQPIEMLGTTSCNYCEYAAVCHYDVRLGDAARKIAPMNVARVMELLASYGSDTEAIDAIDG